jgi:hypothetical protein
MEKLLQHGANPNAWYKGCTLWQYTIHHLHVLSTLNRGPLSHASFRETWLEALNLLLRHGADAEAYWTEDVDARTRQALGKGYSLENAKRYDIFKISPHIWTHGSNKSTILSKGQRYKEFQHPVSEVICDVFGEDIPEKYEQICTVL